MCIFRLIAIIKAWSDFGLESVTYGLSTTMAHEERTVTMLMSTMQERTENDANDSRVTQKPSYVFC